MKGKYRVPPRRLVTAVQLLGTAASLTSPVYRSIDSAFQGVPTWKAVPAGRVVRPAPDFPFGHIADAAVGENGELFVFDRQPPFLHIVDRNGVWAKAVGHKGRGPGEFLVAGRLGWKADTLWAVDPSQERISLFRGATVVRTVSTAGKGPFGPERSNQIARVPSGERTGHRHWAPAFR